MNRQNLTIIGAGCIGRRIAQAAHENEIPYSVRAVCDIDADQGNRLIEDFAPDANLLDLNNAIKTSGVVIEAATAAVVAPMVKACRSAFDEREIPKHIFVMSVGGLLDVDPLITDRPPIIHVPSGAIGGLEAIQAMRVAGLDTVELTTRKPPAGLGMDITEEEVLFEGSAADVIRLYPKNVNVAIALSFAGIGPEKTKVKLVADPAVDRNTHHVRASGNAGEVEFISRNMPFPDNPKTSYLAALSAIALLGRMGSAFQVG